MSTKVQVFHNPNCTKCRLTMELLSDKGVETSVIEYLNTPPTTEELTKILDLLKLQPRDLMRKHEAPYQEIGLDNPELSREQLLTAMIENPILIERPIIINGDKAIIGRPPEKVLDIL